MLFGARGQLRTENTNKIMRKNENKRKTIVCNGNGMLQNSGVSLSYLVKLGPVLLKVTSLLVKVVTLQTHALHGFARHEFAAVEHLAPHLHLVRQSVRLHLLQQQVLLQLVHSIAQRLHFGTLSCKTHDLHDHIQDQFWMRTSRQGSEQYIYRYVQFTVFQNLVKKRINLIDRTKSTSDDRVDDVPSHLRTCTASCRTYRAVTSQDCWLLVNPRQWLTALALPRAGARSSWRQSRGGAAVR